MIGLWVVGTELKRALTTIGGINLAKRKGKDLKVNITERMDAELTTVAGLAGSFKNEIIRTAIRNELTRLKKQLRETFLSPTDYVLVRNLAAERGITIEQVLSEYINHDTYRKAIRENMS